MATPLLLSTRIVVLLLILSEHFISFMIPTILAYMLHDFLSKEFIYPDPKSINADISYYAAIIEGSNRAMAFLGALVWGTISDKIGRKYSLLMTLSSSALASIGFGLSSSFEMALVLRMVQGFLTGTIPITKAMLRDVSDDSNLPVLYGYFGTGYGLGSILGPLCGGLFSRPTFLDYKLFYNYPYLIPLLIQY
jgi:MFS family permease